MKKGYIAMLVAIVLLSSFADIAALKRVLWDTFQTRAKLYKEKPSKDRVDKLFDAFEALMDASPKEASQVWKDDAARQMKSFYSDTFNPLEEVSAYQENFEQFYLKNIDKLCQHIPPGVTEKIKSALVIIDD